MPLDDTDTEAARVHRELLRKASPARRVALALSLSRTVIELARRGIARRMPGATERERDLRFVELHYGRALAEELRTHFARAPR